MERKAIYTNEDIDILLEKGKEWNFHEEETQEHLHSLHPYPAKFIPQIPRKAILKWSKIDDLVYDPFTGCGTTLLEASLLGRPSIGTDNNSVAITVSKAKTAIYSDVDLAALINFNNTFDSLISNRHPDLNLIPNNKNFVYWFSEEILSRLSILKSLILDQAEPIKSLLLAVFSSIIVRVSFQDSDTRYAKVTKTINPSDVNRIFKSKLKEAILQLPEVIVPIRASVEIHQADARYIPFINSASVSLIVTSPPYLNAYDYHKYHRQRIHWLDGNIEFARDIEIGSHDEFTRTGAKPDQFFTDMGQCFDEWMRVLKSGGRCVIIIGDAIVSKEPVQVGDTFIKILLSKGFELEERSIRQLHTTKRAFNSNSRINKEHLIVVRKY